MKIPKVKNENQISFVQNILGKKILDTGKAMTEACAILGEELDLSYATVYNILRTGALTFRIVERMAENGWFTHEAFEESANKKSKGYVKKSKEKLNRYLDGFNAGFKEGFAKGYNTRMMEEYKKDIQ